jgi:hypothetical protein
VINKTHTGLCSATQTICNNHPHIAELCNKGGCDYLASFTSPHEICVDAGLCNATEVDDALKVFSMPSDLGSGLDGLKDKLPDLPDGIPGMDGVEDALKQKADALKNATCAVCDNTAATLINRTRSTLCAAQQKICNNHAALVDLCNVGCDSLATFIPPHEACVGAGVCNGTRH